MIARWPARPKIAPARLIGVVLLSPAWLLLWTTDGFLNPVMFTLMWTGAALLMWSVGAGYPGVRRHLALALVSAPIWWYFEAVNLRTGNWEYLGRDRYDTLQYAVLASIAFATVVPALVSAAGMLERLMDRGGGEPAGAAQSGRRLSPGLLIGLGAAAEAATLAAPTLFFPLVWVAPFLLVDGVVAAAGGRSLIAEMAAGAWRRSAFIGGGGLLCGGLWEAWNFWAFPKWVYDVPLLDFAPVFEMPLLGYGGYVPFAWSVLQAVALVDLLANRLRSRRTIPPRAPSPDPGS